MVKPWLNVTGGTTSQKVVAFSTLSPRMTGLSKRMVSSCVAEASKVRDGAWSVRATTVACPASGSALFPRREMDDTETLSPNSRTVR